jgi:protein-S-isoprenylcysteine O-methyltransferase Ste14
VTDLSAAETVVVLSGGLSHEREVSLRSGRRVSQALRSRGAEVVESDVDSALVPLLVIAAFGQFIIPAIYLATGAPREAEYPISVLQVIVGVAIMAAALVMFRVTHKQLGRNWSVSLETRTDHKLVTEGLYRWVRHPMYSSFLLLAIGQCLLLPNWIAGPIGLLAIAILFFFRVGREEAMMMETFGEEYRRYMSRTARIVPFVY